MTLLENLTKVRALLADPTKWTKGYLAKDESGNPTFAESSNAACYCMLGAINSVASPEEQRDVKNAVRFHIPTYDKSIADFNDDPNTNHHDVLNLLDRTIAHVSAQG
ncbi:MULTISPECIES: hypothetical protein [unclassified Beijerinckia]|uniref:DUF6197 family protein n=1 Tax=unclassified Beijerinckia TaxID=2638183 RepID=UPI00089C4FBD|nr:MULTISPECIES: hypothetical protein [unclassified Beijerinckia]MDH7796409.1 hypothetical protein [Beijerinckia sp. GAS462]SEC43866.1 hypothetical protein SAMN05443249_2691 [Beijerinckia sp. 28-YEA-48]